MRAKKIQTKPFGFRVTDDLTRNSDRPRRVPESPRYNRAIGDRWTVSITAMMMVTFYDYFDGMHVPGGSDARENARVVSASVINAQPVLKIGISTRICRPTLRVFSTHTGRLNSIRSHTDAVLET